MFEPFTSASETTLVHSVSNAISAKHTPLIVIHSFIKIKSILCFYQFCRCVCALWSFWAAATPKTKQHTCISNKSKNFQLYAECGMHVFREGARTLLPGAFDRCLIKYIRVSVMKITWKLRPRILGTVQRVGGGKKGWWTADRSLCPRMCCPSKKDKPTLYRVYHKELATE